MTSGSGVAGQTLGMPDSAVAGQMSGAPVSAVAGQISGAPDPVVAGDPAVASDEATNDAVQGAEREEHVNVKRQGAEASRTAAQHARNVANLKKEDPDAMLPSESVTREEKFKQPDELYNGDKLQTMPR